ncbi:MAG: YbfB/YjiJ family MFS transporter [Gammaproteobacteria bacterium]|nr:YbfB/YjiJ family MFS transporter [Gammaproteobacteria bacterium]
MQKRSEQPTIHYGWWIVLAGTLTVFSSLGLGRFALGMLLPSMGESIPLSYEQMGFVGTGNFIGYLIAVITSGHMVRAVGSRATIACGLFITGTTLVAVGSVDHYYPVLILYFLTGFGSGTANVPIMALVSHWFYRSERGKAAGIMVVGNGVGIMLTGLLVPTVIAQLGVDGWRLSWQILGYIVILTTAICALLLRNDPAERGLSPIGKVESDGGSTDDKPMTHHQERKILSQLGSIYFLFGTSYVIYATFIVTTLITDFGLTESAAGNVWFWIGGFSLISGPLFGTISDRWGRARGLILVFSLQTTSYLLIALSSRIELAYISVFLFGICAWSIPSIMAAAVGDRLGPSRAAYAFGIITFLFGFGQIVGPAVAGIMAEESGSFSSSYLLAALLAALAILLASWQPREN